MRIAIGDNLLERNYAADLMRLNKSFIVQRSLKGRQMFAAYKQLSAYIHHSLSVDHESIWIAQREGRAKDGWDRSEPAIIKMLSMSKEKQVPIADYIRELRIVPVAISYELDPCDGAKARELRELATTGDYEKSLHEDLYSIGKGISGEKGAVHVAFGEQLSGEYGDAEEVAAAIDKQIALNYKLQRSNLYAWKMVDGELPDFADVTEMDNNSETRFRERINTLPKEDQDYVLEMYVNPVRNRLAYL